MAKKKDRLVRFGVAMEESLLGDFDRLVEARGSTRSEAFRDVARAVVSESKARSHVEAVGALTLVYDHHVRDLTDTLTDMQHDLGDQVRSAMHVHLNHELCLEVIVLRGHADDLQAAADRILGTRGVTHGGIEIFAFGAEAPREPAQLHSHSHGDAHPHAHPAAYTHSHPPSPAPRTTPQTTPRTTPQTPNVAKPSPKKPKRSAAKSPPAAKKR